MSKILLACVVAPHGLKGEVRTKLFTEVGKLRAYGALSTGAGRILNVEGARETKPGEAIVSFAGIADRDAAETLKGAELYVDRDALPALDKSEFYHADLVGLSAFDTEDRLLGRVAAIHNFGAGDVIEIVRGDGDSILLAFTRANVPAVDLAARRLVIAVPEEVEAGKSVE